jgi:uncharacterized protein
MPDDFQLLIKPVSADCNQSCRYCFYRRAGALYADRASHRMSQQVLDLLVRRYLKLGMAQSVFSWQGGEPTLAGLDFYRAAVQLMQVHGKGGQSVSNALQTNGLLLDDEWCSFLRQYRFLVGLSLDGPAEIHDRHRIRGDDQGTHADVLRALKRLQEQEVTFNVLAVVTSASASQARRIYGWLREQGVAHMQFIPCVEAEPDGRPSPFSVSAEAFGEFLCELFDAWLPEARHGVSERLFDALIQRELTGRSGMCVLDGACGGYLVVEHNGDAYPCDFFVEDAWRLGNIEKTPLDALMQRGRMRQFRALRRTPEQCESCRWKDLCRGGCLKDRSRFGAAFDRPTTLCLAYQRFFDHAMDSIRALAREIRDNPSRPPLPRAS